MDPEQIENKEFLIGLRGYDRDEVDRFLKQVAEEVRKLQPAADLASAPAEPQEARSLYEQVGQETSRILLAAEEAGNEIKEAAKTEAASLMTDARARAEEIDRVARERQSVSEDYLKRLEEARGVLATQLVDVGRRLEETVSRLQMPVETPKRPPTPEMPRNETPAAEAEAITPTETRPAEEAEAPEEPPIEPAADEPPDTSENLEASAEALDEMLEEIRKEREAGRRQVEEALAGADVPAEASAIPGVADVPPETGEAMARRVEALGDLSITTSGRLKRLLQEDQNALLDNIRTNRGRGDFETDISPYEEQLGRIRDGLREPLQAAFDAGRTSAGATEPGDPRESIDDLVTKQVLEPLRSEISRVVKPGLEAQDTPTAIGERAGDVYRVWKGVRTEMLGEGLAFAMYHYGLLDRWGEAGVSGKRWALSTDEPNCTGACRINSDAGMVGITDPFPSGHSAPPAHGGCNCCLVSDG